MKRVLGFGFAMLTFGAATAHATTFQLSFSSAADQSALGGAGITGFSGSATLTGTKLLSGGYNITAATGTTIIDPNFANQAYTYIPNPSPPFVSVSPDGFTNYDGLVLNGTPSLTQYGLLWTGNVNGADENIFYIGGGLYAIQDVWDQNSLNGPSSSESVINLSITQSAVPEPATWALMGLGFAGLGFAKYRKVKTNRAAISDA